MPDCVLQVTRDETARPWASTLGSKERIDNED
jgi:hypothetical protein